MLSSFAGFLSPIARPFHYNYAMTMVIFDLNQIQDHHAGMIVSCGLVFAKFMP
jgi:hypothetical protein